MSVELVPWPIPPGLRGQVVRLTGYAERLAAPTVYEELPATFVPLILNVGSPYRLLDADGVREYPASFVAGLGVAPAYVQSTCAALCVQVDLSPLAACRVLRGADARARRPRGRARRAARARSAELEGRLADAADWDERRSLAEAFVVRRLREAPPLPADVEYAWRRLGETGGTIRVGELVTELRCSRKHLEARFREAVGLPPKTAAALFRFNRALRLLEAGERPADVAHACGYADQPHMTREFRRFTGTTPVAFLQDAAAAAA